MGKVKSPPGNVPHSVVEGKKLLGRFSLSTWALLLLKCLILLVILYALYSAYTVRILSVKEYGELIHEFDPWFNYRATEYLSEHGWSSFFHWFDYMSWYPLGRPVGSSIYPGMQLTAVAIHRVLNAVGISMSLKAVCVYIPAWFGVAATAVNALITYETTGSLLATATAAYTFSILPAHTMRSMAGEFDNECIAVTAMLLTFYLWIRSLRSARSWPVGLVTGLAYGYMVAAWGGHIFVLNMIALHAGLSALQDWALNRYRCSLLYAYSLFFIVGTAIATRVPPVGMAPFKSLEQLSALLIFVFLWALHVSEALRKRASVECIRSRQCLRIRLHTFSVVACGLILVMALMLPLGHFQSLSHRVRALFLKHTRTGNPLVDSVAEHQATTREMYHRMFHICEPGWIWGFILLLLSCVMKETPAKTFIIVYSITAYYFSMRMARLLLLAGPVASTLTGLLFGLTAEHAFSTLWWVAAPGNPEAEVSSLLDKKKAAPKTGTKQTGITSNNKKKSNNGNNFIARTLEDILQRRGPFLAVVAWLLLTLMLLSLMTSNYRKDSFELAELTADPHIVFKAQLNNGQEVMVDDYYQSYLWLKQNTPQDARVLSWWDYGYQITGIGNRTTLADGNTWNHEHIAIIGKILMSSVEKAHTLARHMADYVLIWTGGRGDISKSIHMAMIGNSVYPDVCPNDPYCVNFRFSKNSPKPPPMLRQSLLYHMHEHGLGGVELDRSLFKEVYTSKYRLVRIFQVLNVSEESKRWVADPANRICNPPGSWACSGQYPPAKPIQDMLATAVKLR